MGGDADGLERHGLWQARRLVYHGKPFPHFLTVGDGASGKEWKMKRVCYEISKEEYERADDNPYKIISEDIIMGYGCYGAKLTEVDGKYYLSYDIGSSCD